MAQINLFKPRKPDAQFEAPVEFIHDDEGVIAVVTIGSGKVGYKFISIEHMMTFFSGLMKEAVKVWPDDEIVQEYLKRG